MTAPTSKSKTKNYRLLTVGALRPIHVGRATKTYLIRYSKNVFCKVFLKRFFGYYHIRQVFFVFWKKNILKRYFYMTAPTSKSKTKNYRLLTVGALRPHRLAARPISI